MTDQFKKKILVEVCCGSYYDACQAAMGGADRIELNSALQLGGLTPTTATLELVKTRFPGLKVVSMVRPRGAGFCYGDEDYQVMLAECSQLLEAGTDGIAFGCLKPDGRPDEKKNGILLERIKRAGKEAVFHRAFDCTPDPYEAIEQLIAMGVDRILTSGQKATAPEGAELIAALQKEYGSRIQLLAGSGINARNAGELIQATKVSQLHSSCKDWIRDETTSKNQVSYRMADAPYEMHFDVVSAAKVRELIRSAE